MKKKILVLGGAGMLGYALCEVGSRYENLEIHTTIRKSQKTLARLIPHANIVEFDLSFANIHELSKTLRGFDYVINAIGFIPQKFTELNSNRVNEFYLLNSFLPLFLDEQSSSMGYKYIQVGTDCVFDGKIGMYSESSIPNAKDHYGLSKSISETNLYRSQILRCSIIGKELKAHRSLLGWFLRLPRNAIVNGYTNHLWNGLTVEHLSRIIFSLIDRDEFSVGLQHVIPEDIVSKFQLLKYFADIFERHDIQINPIETEIEINRSLATDFKDKNERLWHSAGMEKPLSIQLMVRDYHDRWKFKF